MYIIEVLNKWDYRSKIFIDCKTRRSAERFFKMHVGDCSKVKLYHKHLLIKEV